MDDLDNESLIPHVVLVVIGAVQDPSSNNGSHEDRDTRPCRPGYRNADLFSLFRIARKLPLTSYHDVMKDGHSHDIIIMCTTLRNRWVSTNVLDVEHRESLGVSIRDHFERVAMGRGAI